MPAHRLLPDNGTLRHWVKDDGLTHQQVADRIYTTTGVRVSRTTVSAALSRAGISKPTSRYRDELPWRVKIEHIKEYPARMLRLLGRRRAGLPLNPVEEDRLDAWLLKLEEDHAVIAYDPESPYGFYYIEKNDVTDGLDGIPIRRHAVKMNVQ
jgi:hypothetical protein